MSVETSILHLFSDVRTIPANDLTADAASFLYLIHGCVVELVILFLPKIPINSCSLRMPSLLGITVPRC